MTHNLSLQPRHEKAAARTATALFLTGAVLLVAYHAVEPPPASPGVLLAERAMFFLLTGLGVMTWLVPAKQLARLGAWPILLVVGIMLVSVLVLLFPDQPDLVHSLMALPVAFAASQMRAPVATATTTLAIGANTVTLAMTKSPMDAFIHVLYAAPALIVMTVLLAQAMNRQERLIDALHKQAAVDPLTGLMTRRVLDETLQHALSTAPRPEGTALILVDVDEFKSINDTHGHPVGDDALVHLAAVLSGQVRTGDAVISRLGGDELAVLLPGCSAETAAARAEQVVDAVRAAPLLLTDGTLMTMSVSAGVAHAPRHVTGPRTLYAAADAALYEAKKDGRDRVALARASA
jgi:diguanylate cyclase (GGDEF)-like protein